mmetsp:Transcript_15884/g.31126  ORF Transcript_15884/g.31126 Transcript_15884/m.31126 type:complete len:206 (+) Transcript_15884:236-853(+)
MNASLRPQVTGPQEVIIGTSLYEAVPLASVFSRVLISFSFLSLHRAISSPSGGASNPSHRMRSPTLHSAGMFMRSTAVWSAFEAAITMPLETTPTNLLGLRLHATKTLRFSKSFSVQNLTSPETIWRGSWSPTSICSTYKVSAASCFFTATTLPTLMSKHATPVGTIFLGGGPFFFLPFLASASRAARRCRVALCSSGYARAVSS